MVVGNGGFWNSGARLSCGGEALVRRTIELTSLYRDIVVTFPVPLVEDVPGGPGLCGRLVVGVAVRFLFFSRKIPL